MQTPLPYEIADAFRVVGVLWAREQANADDDGATQVEGLMKALRKYADHEQQDGDSSIDPFDCYC